ncbi:hypothetical protein [Paenisporosarcina antarctica]|uniref:Uncharacterized protein n=1 Tax=Paenisporosarcina antarctica TaxID=417367 RepID=A0A4P6ZZQ6_9BACL|nr:hypothetical protein [Paenisporosarcina antarctica]QBP41768.1 hypothetical protein E2636_11690 [Paenisporosarcina antarctica]
MKKWLAIVPLVLILSACSDDNSFKFNDIKKESNEQEKEQPETTQPKENEASEEVVAEEITEVDDTEVVEEQPKESADESEEDSVSDDTTSENEVVANKGLVVYMPKRAIKKTFLLEEFEIVREVKAVKGNRMLEFITFGDVVTKQISEWTPTKLTMLFNNAEGVEDVTIDNFEATSAPEVYIDLLNEQTGPQAWKVVEDDLTLKIPAGTYKDVMVIEQTIVSDVSKQQTITRFYFGKGLGVIKEETITTNGNNKTSYVMEMNRIE